MPSLSDALAVRVTLLPRVIVVDAVSIDTVGGVLGELAGDQTSVSFGRRVVLPAYSLELNDLKLPPGDACIIRQPKLASPPDHCWTRPVTSKSTQPGL